MFIIDYFDLPSWFIYVELTVYFAIIVFGIIPLMVKIIKRDVKKHREDRILFEVQCSLDKIDSTKASCSGEDILKYTEDTLLKMKVTELRPLARDLKIKNWWNIRKEELVKLIIEG